MVELRSADDGGSDDRLGEQPSQRHLGTRNAAARRHFRYAVDDFLVGFLSLREQPHESLVGLGAHAGVVPVAGQLSARLRAPRDDADPLLRAEWEHLAFLLAVEQIDKVLHADEAGPAVLLGDAEGAAELPSVHRRGADIACLARLDDIVQRLEGLLDRRFMVPAVDLIEIDVVGAETPEAGVDLHHDGLARQPSAIRPRTHPAIDLGGDDDLVATREILDRATEDLLAAAERVAVRRVEEVDAGFKRALDERAAFLLAQRPGMVTLAASAIAHAAEADPGDVEAGAAQLRIIHRLPRISAHHPEIESYGQKLVTA